MLGVFEAGFFPGVLLYLSYWILSSRRAGVMALFLSAMAISGIIGGPISGGIVGDGMYRGDVVRLDISVTT
ncbi:hypothetical protein [Pseudonocardia sp. DSM 110487]|uniref:hypothetical protein n=1 Tax=Pseudonocardia sp. DSM 110487 TaxID=2865833 RepID=UPI002101E1D9|nr:hypothetical protein [Pseudonocardia sp. DSM 110487]